jgi:ATP-dependent DNA helicase RecG
LRSSRASFKSENEYVEFKSGTGNQPLQDAIVAFSNADGGLIFVGIKDDGSVVKRELTQGTLDAITQAFRDTRDPGNYSIRQIHIGDTPIVIIKVARRVNGFAQTSNGRVLARRGSHEVALFGDELRRLLVDRSLERFDEHDSGVALTAASANQLRAMSKLYAWRGRSDLHERLCERGPLGRSRSPTKAFASVRDWTEREPSVSWKKWSPTRSLFG